MHSQGWLSYHHGLWCIGGCDSPLIRGFGFESCEWKKSCWERHLQVGPAIRDLNLVRVLRAPDTERETKKKVDWVDRATNLFDWTNHTRS